MALKLEEIKNNEELSKYLNTIATSNLKDFATFAVTTYGSRKKLKEANAVIDYLEKYYTKKKILAPNVDPTFFDLMKVTCLVHNLFIDDSWVSVFKTREVLQDVALNQYKISWENVQHVFSMVEAQLGTDMPVVSCHVKPGTPQDDFVTACWVVKEYIGREKCYSSKSDKGKA
jgi:hypothetical protein